MIKVEKVYSHELDELSSLYYQLGNKKSNMEDMEEIFLEIDNNPNYRLLGVKVDKKLVGTAMVIICNDLFFKCRPFVLVENVIVGKEYQRQGFGTILFKEIEKIAKDNDCYCIMFLSNKNRINSHKFYNTLGYTQQDNLAFKKYL